MTCQEFKRLFNETSPSDCTRAERAAHIQHRNMCESCREWFDIECRLVLATVTPKEISRSLKVMIPIMNADQQDPEAR